MQKIVSEYTNLRIGVLGSHSALEIMDGAKDEDIGTIVFCQKEEKFLTKDLTELQIVLKL